MLSRVADSVPADGEPTPAEELLAPREPVNDRLPFESFYRSYFARLVAFLLFQGACETDAAEVAQDCMAKLFQRWASIEQPAAWVRVVAVREWRRRQTYARSTAELTDQTHPYLLRDGVQPRWCEEHDVLRLLRLLPERQRQVLAWTYDGYAPEEIAGFLDLAPTTVRANLYKARRALIRHLTGDRLARPDEKGGTS